MAIYSMAPLQANTQADFQACSLKIAYPRGLQSKLAQTRIKQITPRTNSHRYRPLAQGKFVLLLTH